MAPALAFWCFLFAGGIQLDERDPAIRRLRAIACLILWSVSVAAIALAGDEPWSAIARDAGTAAGAGFAVRRRHGSGPSGG